MDTTPTLILVLLIPLKARLLEHIYAVGLGAGVEKGHVEKVAVEGGEDGGADGTEVGEEAREGRGL